MSQGLGQFDQLQIDFAHGWKILRRNFQLNAGQLLEALYDIEAAAAAVTPGGIARIRDQLQFVQNKSRDDEPAFHETGFADIGYRPSISTLV